MDFKTIASIFIIAVAAWSGLSILAVIVLWVIEVVERRRHKVG